jgi:hypothetical protein
MFESVLSVSCGHLVLLGRERRSSPCKNICPTLRQIGGGLRGFLVSLLLNYLQLKIILMQNGAYFGVTYSHFLHI